MPLTSYPILNPADPIDPATLAIRSTQCALAVMAKAPRTGKVKTRLAPPLTLEQSAALNICFLRDTTQNLAEVCAATEGQPARSASLISYTPIGDESLFDNLLPPGFALIPQRGDSFGERLLYAAEDIFACGYAAVCLIDSDSPTVPAAAFAQAINLLARPGDRVVLGPAHDGGYYLIGLKLAHATPFNNITWSTATVADETRDRCRTANLELIELPLWYDVDDATTLDLLTAELLASTPPPFATTPGYPAPHTRAFLRQLQQGSVQL
jgi:hypothetical protein